MPNTFSPDNGTGIFKQRGKNLRKLTSDEDETSNGRGHSGEERRQVLRPPRKQMLRLPGVPAHVAWTSKEECGHVTAGPPVRAQPGTQAWEKGQFPVESFGRKWHQ